MFRKTTALLAVCALGAGLGIAGCGGSSGKTFSTASGAAASSPAAASTAAAGGEGSGQGNGIAAMSGNDAAAAVNAAIAKAKTAHVKANGTEDGATMALDMDVSTVDGATGTMTMDNATVKMVISGDKVYLNGDSNFWAKAMSEGSSGSEGAAAAALLSNKWLSVDSGTFGDTFDAFGDFSKIIKLAGTITKSDPSGDPPTVTLTNSDGDAYVIPTTGEPLPISGKASGGETAFEMSKWGEPVSIKVPADAVDLTSLIGNDSSN